MGTPAAEEVTARPVKAVADGNVGSRCRKVVAGGADSRSPVPAARLFQAGLASQSSHAFPVAP
jgi:hypothetical protein